MNSSSPFSWVPFFPSFPDPISAARKIFFADLLKSRAELVREIQSLSAPQSDPQRIAKLLKPWRKGPFSFPLFSLDAEWRCNMKWDRLKAHLGDLTEQHVGDIGCGNGYYLYRLQEAGAKRITGFDPGALSFLQFAYISYFSPAPNLFFEPLGYQLLEAIPGTFDTLLCLGVVYHQKSPAHLIQTLFSALKPGGHLFLETLGICSSKSECLIPNGRYAKMKNVYWLPSPLLVTELLQEQGFEDIELISQSTTSSLEQRVTDWSSAESLSDFLNPEDSSRTIEGYHAPERFMFSAKRKPSP